MAKSPTVDAEGPVRVTLSSNGTDLSEKLQIISVTVHRAINKVPGMTLVLADGDMPQGTFPISDSADFVPGAQVVVRAGYGDNEADIFKGIVVRHGLTISGANDTRLIVQCRDEAGTMKDGAVKVGPPDLSSQPVLAITYGEDLQEFQADLDAGHPSGLTRRRGRMKFQGSALAAVGGQIELKGVGDRFNGTVFVTGLTHQIQDGDWITEAEFGTPVEWFAERVVTQAPPASGRVPGIEGLHVGVVLALAADPEGQHRVQVTVPGAGIERVWARLLQFHASSSFGAFFVPEAGDEVLLGWFNNDPDFPVVLGSLYSSRNTPPFALEAANRTKAIVIEDQNGNKVELNSNGITLDSPKDIRITAKGAITLEAVNAVTIKSQADVSAEGLNVNCTAQLAFVAKGSATAELSASGQTTVTGAIVMIN